jgi:hypothetical protein
MTAISRWTIRSRAAAGAAVALLFSAGSVPAIDESIAEQYFQMIEKQLRAEYRSCTGDSAPVNRTVLFMWRKELDNRANSFDYLQTAKDYVKATATPAAEVRMCDVVEWKEMQMAAEAQRQETARQDSLHREQEKADSLLMRAILGRHPASSLDFSGIPFNCTKREFLLFYRYRCAAHPLPDTIRDSLIAHDFMWGGRQYMASFCFTRQGIYYKYAIESAGVAADSVDAQARPLAAGLARMLQLDFGKPAAVNRIGFFDIKAQCIAPLMTWETVDRFAAAGFAKDSRLYRVKAVVLYKPIAPLLDRHWREMFGME